MSSSQSDQILNIEPSNSGHDSSEEYSLEITKIEQNSEDSYPLYVYSLIEHLETRMSTYASEEDISLAKKAFFLAYEKHREQVRKSGEPYFIHPYEVALILTGLNASGEMIAAGFLHDVLEDTDYTPEEMKETFGKTIYQLVDGVTKLSQFSFSSKEERLAENFRRMFLAMAKDIRVVVIKLADRLHNMRTLDHMPEHKQRKKAQESLDIFAPLANRLGIGRLKWELEDLCLRYLHPEKYWQITQNIAQKRDEREQLIQDFINQLKSEMELTNVEGEIKGRPKHFYSIYQKMEGQNKDFKDIYDFYGLRVIVDSERNCYQILGIVHSLWKPVPGRFKDYIAMPKQNMYQSLHTTVIGPTGLPLEVQIRTTEMQQIAEFGIAAHWRYKENNKKSTTKKNDLQLAWLKQLLEWQSELKDAQEYMDSVKGDLFQSDDVYVFTPRGDVYALPKGSTPIDFAYRIHTEVGNTCIGAKIDGRIATLDTVLENGCQVEIRTSKNGHPRLDWINFVATNQAKNNIRKWFKKEHREDNIKRGRELLESEFGKDGIEQFIKSEGMEKMAKKFNRTSVEDLLASIGHGEITPQQLLNRIKTGPLDPNLPDEKVEKILGKTISQDRIEAKKQKQGTGILIGGESGMLVHFSNCCSPVPGEPIIGVVTRSRGVAIHSRECNNLSQVNMNRFVPASWGQMEAKPYPVELEIATIDRVGLLKDLLTKVTDHKINILAANISTHPDKTATINLVVEVLDIKQLKTISQKIEQISDILSVNRLHKSSKTMNQVNRNNQSKKSKK